MTVTKFVLFINIVLATYMLCIVLMAYGHLPNLVADATSESTGPISLVPKWHVLICPSIALLFSIFVTLFIELRGAKTPDAQISRGWQGPGLKWAGTTLLAQIVLARISWLILHTAKHFLDAAKDEQLIFVNSFFLLNIVLQSVWTAIPKKTAERAARTADQAKNELLQNIGLICIAVGLIVFLTFISEFASPAEKLTLKPIAFLVFIAMSVWTIWRLKKSAT
jgi:hypothetical protein